MGSVINLASVVGAMSSAHTAQAMNSVGTTSAAGAASAVLTGLSWIYLILSVAAAIFELWAFVDCLVRPASSFVAAHRAKKLVWAILTLVALLIGIETIVTNNVLGMFSLIAVVIAGIYLVRVRPAVRSVTVKQIRPRRGTW